MLLKGKERILIAAFLLGVISCCFAQEEVKLIEITVKKGDTLYKFAQQYLRDPTKWPEIYKYNKDLIKDPDLILPQMVIKVPIGLLKDEIADLVYIRNNVRTRKKGQSEWEKAELYARLFSEDGVRTFADSLAHIRFIKGEIIKLGENSLVILRPEVKEETVELLSGELRASEAKVLTASAVVEPQVSLLSKPDFRTKIKEDKTTLVAVYKGKVDLIAQGERVTVPEGFMSQAKLNFAPEKPVALPPPPDLGKARELGGSLAIPETAEKGMNFEEKLAKLDFSQRKKELGIKFLHIQVASDPDFNSVLEDQKVETIDQYKRTKLPDGEYYWRISYIYEDDLESEFTPAGSFRVVSRPPLLEVFSPKEGEKIRDEFVKVKGRTQRGCVVTVNDKVTHPNEEGYFMAVVPVNAGNNIIEVRSEDEEGNQAVQERVVQFVPGNKPGFWKGGGIAAIAVGLIVVILVSAL